MHIQSALLPSLIATASSSSPGYNGFPTFINPSTNSTPSFGTHYAVLNLDLINNLVAPLASSSAGSTFINNTATWINAVHALSPPPLSIFTRIYFSNPSRPELGPKAQFGSNLDLGTRKDNKTEVYSAFKADEDKDVVLSKIRYYAGAGNALEEILSSNGIDTVIISGVRTSGVVISTAYRLFDMDYRVFVILNNTIETPPDEPDVNRNILEGIFPKVPVNVITLEQALAGINASTAAHSLAHGN